ncbi:unnamed protein product [Rhizophagus irregularis]|nr:unnamed protein product [Rhizophagus irregularis]
MEKFCAEIIRRATHQTLAAAGFEKSSRISGDVLADVFKEYLMFLGKSVQEAATMLEWTKTEGRVLGGYAGRKPTVLKELLRSGLPNEMDDIDLPIVETKEIDKIKQMARIQKKTI